MDVTEAGIDRVIRLVQPENADEPIVSTDEPRDNDVAPEQPEKALLPIVSTALGMVIFGRLEQP